MDYLWVVGAIVLLTFTSMAWLGLHQNQQSGNRLKVVAWAIFGILCLSVLLIVGILLVAYAGEKPTL